MKTVISHFYNEEYLLPFWLKHHKKYFDHGILINYHSTDKSVEIIKEICPDWEIINTEYEEFLKGDNEVSPINRKNVGVYVNEIFDILKIPYQSPEER